MGVSRNEEYHFGGPLNKDYSIGVYIGVPLFSETTAWLVRFGDERFEYA